MLFRCPERGWRKRGELLVAASVTVRVGTGGRLRTVLPPDRMGSRGAVLPEGGSVILRNPGTG